MRILSALVLVATGAAGCTSEAPRRPLEALFAGCSRVERGPICAIADTPPIAGPTHRPMSPMPGGSTLITSAP